MHILVTSYFDDDAFKNEQASMETSLSHYMSMDFIATPWQQTLLSVELLQAFMHVLVNCKFEKDQINSNPENEKK